jgi:hypothetical protein
LRPRLRVNVSGPTAHPLRSGRLPWRASLRRRRGTVHAPLRPAVWRSATHNRRRRSGALQRSRTTRTDISSVGGGLAEAALARHRKRTRQHTLSAPVACPGGRRSVDAGGRSTHLCARPFGGTRRATGADGAAPSNEAEPPEQTSPPLEVASLRPRLRVTVRGPTAHPLRSGRLPWRASLRRRRGTVHAPLRPAVWRSATRNRRRRSGALQRSRTTRTDISSVGGGLAEAALARHRKRQHTLSAPVACPGGRRSVDAGDDPRTSAPDRLVVREGSPKAPVGPSLADAPCLALGRQVFQARRGREGQPYNRTQESRIAATPTQVSPLRDSRSSQRANAAACCASRASRRSFTAETVAIDSFW